MREHDSKSMPSLARRTILAGGIAAAIGATSAAALCNTGSSQLNSLIKQHKKALDADKAAWDRVAELTDSAAMDSRPIARVQTSRLHSGIDDNGEVVWQPRFSHSEEDIRQVFARADHWGPGGFFHGPQDWVAERRARHYEVMEEKICEFRAITATRERIENECGYSAALAEAKRLASEVRQLEAHIIDFVPTDLKEAVDKAKWCVWAWEDDFCYVRDDGDGTTLSNALGAIARASA